MAETRKPFIYLAVIAIVLGLIGIVIMNNGGNFGATGKTVLNEKFSAEELSRHNNEKDCWISYDGRVFDITLFLQIYPGDLKNKCGKIINYFPQEDLRLLEEYEIGDLE